ncbi:MAG: hypothetical protein IT194_00795, partial [Microthrixaceae bacterium]|nr:hypothetical protein [Microthrixaceae bacterium]
MPTPVAGVVARSCGTGTRGDCFLSVRSAPSADATELNRLDEGEEVRVVCTVTAESVRSSVLGRRTSIWART